MKSIISIVFIMISITFITSCKEVSDIIQYEDDKIKSVLEMVTLKNETKADEITQEQTEPIPAFLEEGMDEKAEKLQEMKLLSGKIICIDPGHGITNNTQKEKIAPGVEITKLACVSGTRGLHQTEEQLNLNVSKKFKTKLLELGAEVIMTRETAHSDLGNIERARIASESNADLFIRIHADGSNTASVKGISVLTPSSKYIKDVTLVEESNQAGKVMLQELVRATGAINRGVIQRSDITGFNWSTVPVVLVEMGFMTNREEDKLLETGEYQNVIVGGMVEGVSRYLLEN